jgi:hypothetical protein
MNKNQSKLKAGDSVMVKPGTKDPDTGGDLSGWQGRISKVEELESYRVVEIRWDSVTLKNMPLSMIKYCEQEGLDWQVMNLSAEDIEPTPARDTERDVKNALKEILKHAAWLSLDEEGERIQQVLDGIDPDDEMALVEAWEEHLEEKLSFPFEAEVSEPQTRGPLRTGDRVSVKSITLVDDLYGIIVGVRRGKEALPEFLWVELNNTCDWQTPMMR